MLDDDSSKRLIGQKFNFLGYLIDASYMNDEYQAWAKQKYGVRITSSSKKMVNYISYTSNVVSHSKFRKQKPKSYFEVFLTSFGGSSNWKTIYFLKRSQKLFFKPSFY